MPAINQSHRFPRYALFLVFYTLLVIVWGAWVRISKSGDGCGENWPLCHGEIIPQTTSTSTWIEFSHRLSSGLFGFLVLALVIWAWRAYPRGHWSRKMAGWTLFFTVTEALLGARLVLAGLVGDNASVARAYTMALHLMNSLLLTGSVGLTYFWSLYRQPRRRQMPARVLVVTALIVTGFVLIGVTGAIASLSKTLFPAETLWEGLRQDLTHDSHFLVRLRIWHPVMSTVVGVGLGLGILYLAKVYRDVEGVHVHWQKVMVLLGVAIVFGYMTLFLLSPVWMKLTHLLLAHSLWLALLLWIFGLLTREEV